MEAAKQNRMIISRIWQPVSKRNCHDESYINKIVEKNVYTHKKTAIIEIWRALFS